LFLKLQLRKREGVMHRIVLGTEKKLQKRRGSRDDLPGRKRWRLGSQRRIRWGDLGGDEKTKKKNRRESPNRPFSGKNVGTKSAFEGRSFLWQCQQGGGLGSFGQRKKKKKKGCFRAKKKKPRGEDWLPRNCEKARKEFGFFLKHHNLGSNS